jgi:hypothetical protein
MDLACPIIRILQILPRGYMHAGELGTFFEILCTAPFTLKSRFPHAIAARNYSGCCSDPFNPPLLIRFTFLGLDPSQSWSFSALILLSLDPSRLPKLLEPSDGCQDCGSKAYNYNVKLWAVLSKQALIKQAKKAKHWHILSIYCAIEKKNP